MTTPLYYTGPLTDADRLNIKASKARVWDGLVQLTKATKENSVGCLILCKGEPPDVAGYTFFRVDEFWRQDLLDRGVLACLTGVVSEEFDEVVEAIEFYLGGE